MTPGNGPPNQSNGNGAPPHMGPRPFGPMGGGMRPPLIARPSRPNGPPLLPGQPRMPMHGGPPYQNQGWQGPRHMHPGGPRPNMPLMRMPPGSRGPVPGQSPLLRNPGPPMDHQRPQHPQQMQDWNDHSGHGHHPGNNMPPNPQNSAGPRPGSVPPAVCGLVRC